MKQSRTQSIIEKKKEFNQNYDLHNKYEQTLTLADVQTSAFIHFQHRADFLPSSFRVI